MGGSSSKSEVQSQAVDASTVLNNASSTQESTNIKDLIASGRYQVAKPETLSMLREMQSDKHASAMQADAVGMRDMKQYASDMEGLDIGSQRRKVLAQQWRFFLSCEPIQRGLDAGIIFGCTAAAFVAWKKPAKRIPSVISLVFLGGFCVGMISVPLMVVGAEQYNAKRIVNKEKEFFKRQREDFFKQSKE